jgi:hypothetical protein
MRKVTHEVVPVGEGNVCSIEFNLLYRWHATLSAEDTEWTEKAFKQMFGGKNVSEVTVEEFKTHAKEMAKNLSLDKVKEWTFAGYVVAEAMARPCANPNFVDSSAAPMVASAMMTLLVSSRTPLNTVQVPTRLAVFPKPCESSKSWASSSPGPGELAL